MRSNSGGTLDTLQFLHSVGMSAHDVRFNGCQLFAESCKHLLVVPQWLHSTYAFTDAEVRMRNNEALQNVMHSQRYDHGEWIVDTFHFTEEELTGLIRAFNLDPSDDHFGVAYLEILARYIRRTVAVSG